MLILKGETRAEWFHIECETCNNPVSLTDLRWVGGVPQVKAKCEECGEARDLKLHMPTWAEVVPGLESAWSSGNSN